MTQLIAEPLSTKRWSKTIFLPSIPPKSISFVPFLQRLVIERAACLVLLPHFLGLFPRSVCLLHSSTLPSCIMGVSLLPDIILWVSHDLSRILCVFSLRYALKLARPSHVSLQYTIC